MFRQIESHLLDWKKSPARKPLLLRGARQVGKTYIIRKFGQEHFKNILVADFEKRPSLNEIFSGDLHVGEILQKLELVLGERIHPQETLLFFDEIQKCPRALMALRYFKEEKPDLPVIATGSLLDFALTEISVPVGRITYLQLHPLSFHEFLAAIGEDLLKDHLREHPFPADPLIHAKLLGLVKKYIMIGGMPESINAYLKSSSMKEVGQVHLDLIESFRQDFSKYATQANFPHLLKVMDQVPKLVGQQIKYTSIDSESRSEETKKAVLLLERAQIIHRVRSTSGHGLPLGAESSEKIFKAIFLDVGLMQTICGILWSHISDKEELTRINEGSLAEQFVGQELMANASITQPVPLYYWKREFRGSSAEVDYLIAHEGEASPIEVKSAVSGRLKSLHLFCEKYHPKNAFVVSSHPFQKRDHITWIPLYSVPWVS